jgi:hypothetical protein
MLMAGGEAGRGMPQWRDRSFGVAGGSAPTLDRRPEGPTCNPPQEVRPLAVRTVAATPHLSATPKRVSPPVAQLTGGRP